jgi:hypothetical protein
MSPLAAALLVDRCGSAIGIATIKGAAAAEGLVCRKVLDDGTAA